MYGWQCLNHPGEVFIGQQHPEMDATCRSDRGGAGWSGRTFPRVSPGDGDAGNLFERGWLSQPPHPLNADWMRRPAALKGR